MKRFISIVLVCFLLLSMLSTHALAAVTSVDATATLTGRDSVKPCETVKLNFAVSGSNITEIEATLDYDSSLLEPFSIGYCVDVIQFGVDSDEKIILSSAENPINSPTTVMELEFSVNANAPADAVLIVSLKDVVLSDGTNEVSIGDVSWNGTVDGTIEAKWGYATGENDDQAPGEDDWVDSGSLANACRFASNVSSGAAYIQLLEDVNTSRTLSFTTGKNTVLDLNGKTINRGLTEAEPIGCVIYVYGNLTLCDTSITASGKVTGGNNEYGGGGVYIDGGTLTMNGGSIIKNGNAGVFVNLGTFIMNGGSISNNTGAGVDATGTFIMNGGKISGNDVGVNVAECKTFAMNNGDICGNHLGGVWSCGNFTMTGGSIYGNASTLSGGGVWASGGTFTMNDGSNLPMQITNQYRLL